MTKKEMIESFANTEAQKRDFYYTYGFRRIRKEYIQIVYDTYQRGLKCSESCVLHVSRSKLIKWLKALASEPNYCVKHL